MYKCIGGDQEKGMLSGKGNRDQNPCTLLPKAVIALFDGKSLMSEISFTNVSCKLQFIFWIIQFDTEI